MPLVRILPRSQLYPRTRLNFCSLPQEPNPRWEWFPFGPPSKNPKRVAQRKAGAILLHLHFLTGACLLRSQCGSSPPPTKGASYTWPKQLVTMETLKLNLVASGLLCGLWKQVAIIVGYFETKLRHRHRSHLLAIVQPRTLPNTHKKIHRRRKLSTHPSNVLTRTHSPGS